VSGECTQAMLVKGLICHLELLCEDQHFLMIRKGALLWDDLSCGLLWPHPNDLLLVIPVLGQEIYKRFAIRMMFHQHRRKDLLRKLFSFYFSWVVVLGVK
jgi:hypothetical protein